MAVKKEITFEDLDGNEITQEWWFRLDKTDALDMDIVHEKDPANYLKQIMKDQDSRKLLRVWRELLFASVGKREGNLLVKSPEILAEFQQSGAYNQFFSELIEADDAGASFFVSIMPKDVQEKIQKDDGRVYTKDELLAMTDEEFDQVAGTDTKKMTQEHFQIAFQRRNAKAA